ncbi:protein phosphatase 2C domain-containing protein [Chitinophaga sp. Cy-1792]|uniref:protein phosphatase 2C domain-containing protein n=1 Tax=Chitinophaga sp. Cy-1792 TaxID=2608339 RepID=UPI0014213906|nr:protein phosphatase 2C domain-containing protein [Chitinophaga sp. Cy-1792]NIG54940.1 protein phosphatase 2C domain-containing protein [Chitinophaga sp. Cy-1792]
MKVYTTLKMGEHHLNHCEDYLLTADIGAGKIICAVMDGCSMGAESFFAASLTGKLLRKIARSHYYQEFLDNRNSSSTALLRSVLRQLFWELGTLQKMLQLDIYELLNTLVLAIGESSGKEMEFICIGDGLIVIDSALYEFDQHNMPDYIGYHLQEDFDQWFETQQQRISVKDIRQFSLCTDGVLTFRRFDTREYAEIADILSFLLMDDHGADTCHMLDRKMIAIEHIYGLKPVDDVAIVRVCFDK